MSTDNIAAKLATPRRSPSMQALSGLFRTPTRLRTPTIVSHRNKRTRSRTSSLSSSTPSTPSTPSLPAVVLQTYSVSTDSIILTALPSVPFCCHEDLLTMSRAQLETVVHALNARLPRRMRIGPEDDFRLKDDQDPIEDNDGLSRMSESEMRGRIEELVGIRPVVGKSRVSRRGLGLGSHTRVPPAPKAMRTRDAAWMPCEKTPWEMEVDAKSDDSNISIDDAHMGSSPLAGRTVSGLHMRGRNSMLPRLAILQEENEGAKEGDTDSEDNETRPFKRQRRLSSAGAIQDSKGERRAVRESRLVEHMDLSASPLLARDDEASLKHDVGLEEAAVVAMTNSDCSAKMPKEEMQAPLQRRRSARIKEVALKRASSLHAAKKATTGATGLKSTILRSKTLSTWRSSTTNWTASGGANVGKDSGIPRELTIRLPFTSTPPHLKPDPSSWSAPRILRSHSQRLLNLTKTGSLLGRSQSERYPRTSDMAFVTINRPRYRFSQRKSKGNMAAKGDRTLIPSTPAATEHAECQLEEQCGVKIGVEHYGERGSKKENDEVEVARKSSVTESLHLSSVLGSFLIPRSRAPSTSTEVSTRSDCGDSPVRTLRKVGINPTVIADSMINDGITKGVREALGRMAMDSNVTCGKD